jgi:hypothetical protein
MFIPFRNHKIISYGIWANYLTLHQNLTVTEIQKRLLEFRRPDFHSGSNFTTKTGKAYIKSPVLFSSMLDFSSINSALLCSNYIENIAVKVSWSYSEHSD